MAADAVCRLVADPDHHVGCAMDPFANGHWDGWSKVAKQQLPAMLSPKSFQMVVKWLSN